MNERPNGSWTLADARKWLREERAEGVRCPCCYQLAKIYRRSINGSMARTLIAMYRAGGRREFVHPPSLRTSALDTHEASQLSWWGLIEEELIRREDGGRAGWWRVTVAGEQWVMSEITIPKYAYVYDGTPLEVDGPPTSIRSAIGTRFDYEELMGPLILPRDTLFDL